MVETHLQFDRRLRTLGRKHRAMSRGYSTRIRGDGLIVVEPRRLRFHFPARTVIMLFVGFFMFKGFMLASMGPVTYNHRLATLEKGTVVEQGGAWIMQIDAITKGMAEFIGPILR
ncbi:hypothetical protein [Sulfitobacter sabulilitoris]|uniref:Uncharacterized protein n=1 Tax=Sulfitobacter sabulilitoris TaxID=2562655 RepID=A0A5S3PLK3_9RHOB|nr:hypothetical protein [Sulfitobacter sabulilitoris]TMM55257.1 hypothetical protein FDT80_06770 [Sulfitobacter sabulilitoris]